MRPRRRSDRVTGMVAIAAFALFAAAPALDDIGWPVPKPRAAVAGGAGDIGWPVPKPPTAVAGPAGDIGWPAAKPDSLGGV
ncbi:hypothetical protein ACF08O_37780 [Streptomyces paradoxus]|uniref:hypothetical protein n=1 Tax=Streptomyces paradoxus TaxID=66375 RepID=UPI0036F82163